MRHLMFAAAAPTLPLVKEGSLRALGVSSAARLAEAPDIPPIADTVPGFDALGGLPACNVPSASKKTPQA